MPGSCSAGSRPQWPSRTAVPAARARPHRAARRGSHRPWSRAARARQVAAQHRHAGAHRRHHHAFVDRPSPARPGERGRTRAASASRGRPMWCCGRARPSSITSGGEGGLGRRGAARPARSGAGGPAGRAARRRSAPARQAADGGGAAVKPHGAASASSRAAANRVDGGRIDPAYDRRTRLSASAAPVPATPMQRPSVLPCSMAERKWMPA